MRRHISSVSLDPAILKIFKLYRHFWQDHFRFTGKPIKLFLS